ncbi:hypothetical protein FDECE_6739 [Fusarium decemcellulare]|nr:hypothetical protein FDECE_6739 [Fusarium decemcellulare]
MDSKSIPPIVTTHRLEQAMTNATEFLSNRAGYSTFAGKSGPATRPAAAEAFIPVSSSAFLIFYDTTVQPMQPPQQPLQLSAPLRPEVIHPAPQRFQQAKSFQPPEQLSQPWRQQHVPANQLPSRGVQPTLSSHQPFTRPQVPVKTRPRSAEYENTVVPDDSISVTGPSCERPARSLTIAVPAQTCTPPVELPPRIAKCKPSRLHAPPTPSPLGREIARSAPPTSAPVNVSPASIIGQVAAVPSQGVSDRDMIMSIAGVDPSARSSSSIRTHSLSPGSSAVAYTASSTKTWFENTAPSLTRISTCCPTRRSCYSHLWHTGHSHILPRSTQP